MNVEDFGRRLAALQECERAFRLFRPDYSNPLAIFDQLVFYCEFILQGGYESLCLPINRAAARRYSNVLKKVKVARKFRGDRVTLKAIIASLSPQDKAAAQEYKANLGRYHKFILEIRQRYDTPKRRKGMLRTFTQMALQVRRHYLQYNLRDVPILLSGATVGLNDFLRLEQWFQDASSIAQAIEERNRLRQARKPANKEEKALAVPVSGGRNMEKHETARELLDHLYELERAEFDRAIGFGEPDAHLQQGIAAEEDCLRRAGALYNRLLAAGESIRPVPDKFSDLPDWLRVAVKLQKTPMELYLEMRDIPRALLAEKYGEIEAHGMDEPPALDSPEAMSDPDQIPSETLRFAYCQEAIAMRARYMARGYDLPPVPNGWLDIVQWCLCADKIVNAGHKNENRAKDGSDKTNFGDLEGTYRCPSWDSVVTTQEIKRVEREFGTLANTLADLALMVREMDRVAPRETDLAHRVEVMIEPTIGVREIADEAEMAEDAAIDAMTGDGLDSRDPRFVEWQSCETVGFLIRILTSARMLRPTIEMVIGEGQARDCYVNLHRTLTYRDHTALLHKSGGGPVLRHCMQWKGVDGSVERLATCIEHWHRNLMLWVTGDEPKSLAGRDTTPSLCEPNGPGQRVHASKSSEPTSHEPSKEADDKIRLCPHSDDFRMVNWFGTPYPFTSYQAPCVRVWYEHWRTAARDVSDARVLEAAECESKRISDVFKRTTAWRDKIIVEGDTRGTHRLREPTEPKPPERKRNRKRRRPSKE